VLPVFYSHQSTYVETTPAATRAGSLLLSVILYSCVSTYQPVLNNLNPKTFNRSGILELVAWSGGKQALERGQAFDRTDITPPSAMVLAGHRV
jgi:hypothetical protein